ncbi:MAG: VOC family protein [Oscillospiraceae bacterium]|nr:VOC family protein [Oscillospiraceae bacterium]
MKIDKVDHIAINTINIEESVRYYSDLFGFRETDRADMGSCVLVYMQICPGAYLELFDLKGNTAEGGTPENLQGLRHIAFHVDDIKAWEKALKEKEADFVMEITRMEQIRKDAILVRDPNGVIIELSADY